MAIYSLHHGSIGRATHRPGTAGAHIRYIARNNACSSLLGSLPSGIALDRSAISRWLNECERSDRLNARVCDKVMVAIPVELVQSQRIDLVSDFCNEVSQGRIPWVAAIQDKGEDSHNPHAHVVFRDRDLRTGKRVIHSSHKGSTERFRTAWEICANAALQRAGIAASIDRRSYARRGVDRAPSLHLGAAERLEGRGYRTLKGDINRELDAANAALAKATMLARFAEAITQNPDTNEQVMPRDQVLPQNRIECAELLRKRRLEQYNYRLDGSALPRYWRFRRTSRGIEFYNALGRFVDSGLRIDTARGSDFEIAAMLELARAKGWTVLTITGTADFRQRAVAAAIAQGFTVSNCPELKMMRSNSGRHAKSADRAIPDVEELKRSVRSAILDIGRTRTRDR